MVLSFRREKARRSGPGGYVETWVLALIFKPLVFLFFVFFVMLPARFAVQKYMKDGKLKRLLLTRISK